MRDSAAPRDSGTAAYSFGPFRLDAGRRSLTRHEHEIALPARAFNLLSYLIRERHRAVTRTELLSEFWPDVIVEDANLSVNISLLRKALEDGRGGRYIETLPRVGYRFCAPLDTAASPTTLPEPLSDAERPFVGRQQELAKLRAARERALAGQQQLVLLRGEPGIGKSTLLEHLLREQPGEPCWLAQGQCAEHFAETGPYLPIVEGVSQLCSGPGGARALSLLRELAPTWLFQLPRFVTSAEQEELARVALAATPGRMLREMAELWRALAADRPLLWCIEDVHWADPATLDWIAYLAQQCTPARCLLLATYRPGEHSRSKSSVASLVERLHTRGQCELLSVPPLPEPAVSDYLEARFGRGSALTELSPLLHERTHGNPLFLVQLADALAARALGVAPAPSRAELEALARALPDSTNQRIQLELARLSPFERRILEAASVTGGSFSLQAVAAALDSSVVPVERICLRWARHGRWLLAAGESEWPDGTRGSCFSFSHALCRDALYRGLGAGERAQLHQRIAERLERGFGARGTHLAAELGHHFARGTEPWRAVPHLAVAGSAAHARGAGAVPPAFCTLGPRAPEACGGAGAGAD